MHRRRPNGRATSADRPAARSGGGPGPTPTGMCSTRSSTRRTRRAGGSRSGRGPVWRNGRGGGTRGMTRTGSTAPGARTADPPPFLEGQDAERRREQLVGLHLEHVVAWVVLEDRE